MAIIQPPDFAAIMARAPRLNEQGSMFGMAVLDRERRKDQLIGGILDSQAQLQAAQIAADARIEEAKILNNKDNSFGARLARIAPLLGGLGGGSSTNRFAGQALAQGLGLGFTSPTQILVDNNEFLGQLNLFRSGIEPWGASGRAASGAALKGAA